MPVRKRKSGSVKPAKIDSTTIKQTVFIPAPPEKVYHAYLDDKQHSAMTGAKARLNPRPGGIFSAWDGYISGTLFELEESKRIVQDWITSDWPQGYQRSILNLTFTPKANGTQLHLVQEDVPRSQAKSFEKGWKEFYWKPMKKYFSSLGKRGASRYDS